MALSLVVGPGRAGRSLSLAQRRTGDRVLLLGRRPGPWMDWAGTRGIEPLLPGAPLPACRRLLVAVQDDCLRAVLQQVAEGLALEPFLAVHVSGLHGPEVLEPLARRGSRTAAVHPLLPFGDPDLDLEALERGVATVAAEADALPSARRLVRGWGARPIVLPAGVDRRAYHLALSLAANHLTGLLAEAEELLAPALGPEARRAVADLAASALGRYRTAGAGAALTGPVARGDLDTLRAHLAALHGRRRAWYRVLVGRLVDVAEGAGRLSSEEARRLRREFPWPGGPPDREDP